MTLQARPAVLALCLGAALAAGAPAWAHKAHQHGVAELDVAVEPARIVIELRTPLDNLLGFERAPRTDAERQRVDAAVASLRDGATLWVIAAAAGCTLDSVDLKAPVLGLGGEAAEHKGEHADLQARWDFACRDAARAGFVEHGLFTAFARLSRLEVQSVTPRGQMKATLRKPANRIALAR